jgi:hypothetical protein
VVDIGLYIGDVDLFSTTSTSLPSCGSLHVICFPVSLKKPCFFEYHDESRFIGSFQNNIFVKSYHKFNGIKNLRRPRKPLVQATCLGPTMSGLSPGVKLSAHESC